MYGLEWRVTWRREGLRPKRKKFAKEATARRLLEWLTATECPLDDADVPYCCSGRECGCGGQTKREYWSDQRKSIPNLVEVKLEVRSVGDWMPPPEGGK